jgi:adenylosuccinate lyase
MMDAVKKGGDRQALHERIREHSMAAGKRVKEEGLDNDLIERIAADPMFGIDVSDINLLLNPSDYTGRSGAQTRDFVAEYIKPILDANADILGDTAELTV